MDAAKAAQFSMRGATPQEEQALLKHAQALVEEPEEEQVSAAHAGRKHAQQGAISQGAGKAAGKGKGTKQREGGQRRTAKKQAPPAFANGAALPDMQSSSVWTWCRQVAAANGQQSGNGGLFL